MLKCVLVVLSFVTATIVWHYFYGVEIFYEEHETQGVPFLKQRSTWRYEYHNPAITGYGVTPMNKLSPAEKIAFLDFCAVRYGTEDIELCYQETCKGTLEVDLTDGCEPYSVAGRARRRQASAPLQRN